MGNPTQGQMLAIHSDPMDDRRFRMKDGCAVIHSLAEAQILPGMTGFHNTDAMRLAKGDANAFKKLFDIFYVPMVRRAIFYLQDQSNAEDIVQEVFMRIWGQRQKLKEVANVEGYITRWVRNECLNFVKRRSVIDNYLQNFVGREATMEDADPEPYVIAIRELLEKLPAKRREVLMMSIFDSKSYAEIAAELDISINTVKDHIKKAYNYLRREADTIPYPP